MKKILITMAVLTGMVAGAMVFSSFATPKTNDETVCSQINANDVWTYIGSYYGYIGDRQSYKFRIWEKKNACNAYYWVLDNGTTQASKNPDETYQVNGVLRKNGDGKWYAAVEGTIYIIKDF